MNWMKLIAIFHCIAFIRGEDQEYLNEELLPLNPEKYPSNDDYNVDLLADGSGHIQDYSYNEWASLDPGVKNPVEIATSGLSKTLPTTRNSITSTGRLENTTAKSTVNLRLNETTPTIVTPDAVSKKFLQEEANTTPIPGSKLELESAGVAWMPPLIAAITSGIVFFFVGFFVQRKIRFTRESDITASSTEHRMHMNGSRHRDLEMGIVRSVSNEDSEVTPLKNAQNNQLVSTFKSAATNQSPIDIVTASTLYKKQLKDNQLVFASAKSSTFSLTNTGSALIIHCCDNKCTLSGGPLSENRTYQLHCITFHWGNDNNTGSQHLVDGVHKSLEIQFVYWENTNYTSYAEAKNSMHKKAIAIVSCFAQLKNETAEDNKLAAITDILSGVKFKGDCVESIKDFEPVSLLPDNTRDYWTYDGSQTMEPYEENVSWIVFKQDIEISSSQLKELRSVMNYEKDEDHHQTVTSGPVCRQPQQLAACTVLASFP